MAQQDREQFDNKIIEWIDSRLPIFTMMQKEYGTFPTPRNFNYFWSFGGMAMLVLGIMILSGVFLAMNYTPHADLAFDSVERLTRDVNYGWLLRSIHMNGASMFFIVVYIHIFRGLYYGSYRQPRELLWMLGVVILLLMMATAFMGYVLPWSQMSGWGATVITNLFSAFPLVGDGIVTWLWGGFSVDNPTLNRFFALHFLFPFIIVGVVFLHVWALHITGSNNPLGIDVKGSQDTLPFHPYYTVKDSVGIVVFLLFYAYIVFFNPDAFVHADHYKPFDPLVTPPQIVPEWYFLPFYAILRAFTYDISFFGTVIFPAKLQGVLAMLGSIIVLFFMPWLDKSPVRSCRFRPIYRKFLSLLIVALVILTYVGAQHAEEPYVTIGQIATAYYFFFFLVLVPWISRREVPLTPPKSISEAVLKSKKAVVVALLSLSFLLSATPSAIAAGDAKEAPHQEWPQTGFFGTYDTASLQRGFQVYKQVCASCHSMRLLSYRNLADLGYNDAEVRAIAAEYNVTDGPDDEGEMFERPGIPADRFVSPFPNDNAARYANGGALPPDMSLIIKARHHGADYLYALLTGYIDAPEGFQVPEGMHYNDYFPGHLLAMASPLTEGLISYEDGTEATTEQMAWDVTHFLTWAADPHMEARKQTGLKVLLFLLVFIGIMIAAKKKVWKDQ